MTEQWIIKGDERQTTGHGESERRVRIENSKYPKVSILVGVYGMPEIQDTVAQGVCLALNKDFVLE